MINDFILFQKTAYTETEWSQNLWLVKGVEETEHVREWMEDRQDCVYSLFIVQSDTTYYFAWPAWQVPAPNSCLFPVFTPISCQFCSQDSSGRTLQNIKSFFHTKQQYKIYCLHNHNLTHNKSALTSAWLWTDSLESELSVPSVDPRRLRLFALRTIVATVRQ